MSNVPSLNAGNLSGVSPGLQPTLVWQDPPVTGPTYSLQFDCVVAEDWPDEGTTITEHPVEEGADVADHVRVKLPTYTLTIRQTNEPFGNAGPNGDNPTIGPVALPPFKTVQLVAVQQSISFVEWKNNILARAVAQTAGGAIGGTVAGEGGAIVGSVVGGIAGSLLFAPQAVPKTAVVQGQALATGQGSATPVVATYPGVDYVEAVHALLVQLKDAATQFTIVGSKQVEPNMVIESLTFHRARETGTGEDLTIGFKQIRIVATQTITLPMPHLSGAGGAPTVPHGQQAITPDDLSYQEAAQLFASLGWIPPNAASGNTAFPK